MIHWYGPFPPCPPSRCRSTKQDWENYRKQHKQYIKDKDEYWLWQRWYMKLYRWYMLTFRHKSVGIPEYYSM